MYLNEHSDIMQLINNKDLTETYDVFKLSKVTAIISTDCIIFNRNI